MAVILTSPVEGLEVGDVYEGPNEQFHLEQGYARPKSRSKKAAPVVTSTGYVYDNADNPLNGDPTATPDATLPAPAPETFPHSEEPPAVPEVPVNLKLNATKDADLPAVAPETELGQEGRVAHLADYAFEDDAADEDAEPTAEELAAIEAGDEEPEDDANKA